jgi:membrane protease YdiL (CAAX protease family)
MLGGSMSSVESERAFLFAGGVELSLGAIALVFGAVLGVNPREDLPLVESILEVPWSSIGRSAVLGSVLAIALYLLVQLIGKLPLSGIRRLERLAQSQLTAMLGPLSVAQMLVLSLTAGVGEELLFRGLIQNWFHSFFETVDIYRAMPGILVSSLLFGMAHPLTKTYVVIAAVIGLILGLFYWYTRDLLACVVAHSLYDAILLVVWKWSERSFAR